MNGGGLPIVLQHGDEMIAGLEPDFVESGNEGRNLAVLCAVTLPLWAVDDCERIGIARYARDKARAEIKHPACPYAADTPASGA
jgi:hypothetical protein